VAPQKLIIGVMASSTAGNSAYFKDSNTFKAFKDWLGANNYGLAGFMMWDSHWDSLNGQSISNTLVPSASQSIGSTTGSTYVGTTTGPTTGTTYGTTYGTTTAQPLVQPLVQLLVQHMAQLLAQLLAQHMAQQLAQPLVQQLAQPLVQHMAQQRVQVQVKFCQSFIAGLQESSVDSLQAMTSTQEPPWLF
jgi:hypothetical protein